MQAEAVLPRQVTRCIQQRERLSQDTVSDHRLAESLRGLEAYAASAFEVGHAAACAGDTKVMRRPSVSSIVAPATA